ncbi:MAG TPA: hypothetical protein ENH85_00955, partial [Candidatus Scalindua sp.]|nr:hypothetical protein [Candidatus Scalindua sp.]
MIKIKLAIIIILLFIILPGCLARYGEDRLGQLLTSIKVLKKECDKNGVDLTEEKIKEKLGKPGFLKPIYERNLNLSFLDNLKRDSGVSLIPNRAELYDDMLMYNTNGNLESVKLLSYVYDRMGFEDPSLTFYIGSFKGTGEDEPKVFGWDYVEYGNKNRCNFNGGGKSFINYKIYSPAD